VVREGEFLSVSGRLFQVSAEAQLKKETFMLSCCCVMWCRQLEEVDKALEVHRETERLLHEKVTNAILRFCCCELKCSCV